MPLLKHGQLAFDPWTMIEDDDPLPAGQNVIVRLERLLGDDGEFLLHRGGGIGVRLRPSDDLGKLAGILSQIEVIALEFPAFSDGRGYSMARILRGQMAYRGEIRAVGDVLIDQYSLMLQCGFDAFGIGEEDDVNAWLAAAGRISCRYQLDSLGGGADILRARHLPRVRLIAA